MRLERTLTSHAETERVAAALAPLLRAGDVLALSGDLGAGKTTFVRALAGALGIDAGLVSSPTYVIANQYPNSRGPRMAHIDAYRLSGADDLDAIGWDLLTDGSWIVAVEWPDRVGGIGGGAIERDAMEIRLEHGPIRDGAESRHMAMTLPDAWVTRPELPALIGAMRTGTRCPVTGEQVSPDAPFFPFSSERARLADLNAWLTGGHTISGPLSAEEME
ncbi:MAG: tRNA (adenosine(37)-N6)-threonylcarbamoyltransferase complex ATPase subunit type 1 TsaE [Phycisphaeraceae bacterium]|nr:tRNA (adenosine(37)-N6)-threonylcarbamoyltransferase complex ATPase subunit type 1 TsaE [Phycisphaeraceae bacterium]